MRIIDNNGLNYVVDNRIVLTESYCTTSDIKDEFEVKYDGGLPKNVQNLGEDPEFDRVLYLKHYAEMLNKYSGASFYNMTGFGDISILAVLKTLKETQGAQLQGFEDTVQVITTDTQLIKHIGQEFVNKSNPFDANIKVIDYAKLFGA